MFTFESSVQQSNQMMGNNSFLKIRLLNKITNIRNSFVILVNQMPLLYLHNHSKRNLKFSLKAENQSKLQNKIFLNFLMLAIVQLYLIKQILKERQNNFEKLKLLSEKNRKTENRRNKKNWNISEWPLNCSIQLRPKYRISLNGNLCDFYTLNSRKIFNLFLKCLWQLWEWVSIKVKFILASLYLRYPSFVSIIYRKRRFFLIHR